MKTRPTIEDRLWSKVSREQGPRGCWIWTGSRDKDGYGKFQNRGAHRIAWIVTHGPVPDGLYLCHTCDVRLCCNPSHLFPGTQLDNMRDKVNKKRQARGEKNGRARLTAEQVKEIRALRTLGATHRELGVRFGVHRTTIRDIVNGKIWVSA